MPTSSLPSGTVEYRVYGPDGSERPPVVFVHGVLAPAALWHEVAARLGAAGFRCYAPDWPLGSHRIPWGSSADRSPAGAARLIADFLEAHDLRGATLVGNDTGGALCQFLVDARPDLVGRLVLTNCDAFDQFPPQPFKATLGLMKSKVITRIMLPAMWFRSIRNSPLGYGLLATDPDPAFTAAAIAPLRDAAILDDLVAFLRQVRPADLAAVTSRLESFTAPVALVWGMADGAFTPALGRRLAAAIPGATFTEVPGSRTFVALDRPEAVVDAVTRISAVPTASGPDLS
ncbi:alpha/beta fold hydrolase [Tsukamurella soli]|uniref:Alpha/beta fold hydrolase n=1 Tax=Tsukamurella soli TaxID=644556 RepID=A0ABP8K4X8_9ACTN